MAGFRAADVPSQDGRTFLVTGANTGLGFEAAKVLAARGARVLFGCRSQERAEAAMGAVEADHPGSDLAFVELDQADLASVRACADQVLAEETLDVLVNNAGIFARGRELTADGFESQFGVNHLGTFALTGRLLPALQDRDDARIVVTSSIAHRGATMHWDDLHGESGFGAQGWYQQSKLANLLHAVELDRRLRAADAAAIAVACHPGLAKTEIARDLPAMRFVMPIVGPIFNTAAQGAWPTLQAATAPDVEGGEYFGPNRWSEMSGRSDRAKIAGRARNEASAARLWDVSVELTGVDPGI